MDFSQPIIWRQHQNIKILMLTSLVVEGTWRIQQNIMSILELQRSTLRWEISHFTEWNSFDTVYSGLLVISIAVSTILQTKGKTRTRTVQVLVPHVAQDMAVLCQAVLSISFLVENGKWAVSIIPRCVWSSARTCMISPNMHGSTKHAWFYRACMVLINMHDLTEHAWFELGTCIVYTRGMHGPWPIKHHRYLSDVCCSYELCMAYGIDCRLMFNSTSMTDWKP